MKKKSVTFAAIAIKATVVCSLYSSPVDAQSIVGKWKLTNAKESVTDKSTGKTQDLTPQVKDVVKMFEQIIEFHPDHTYFTSNTMTGNTKGFEGSGTYSVSGKQITLQQTKSNVTATGNKYTPNPMNKLPDVMTIISQTGNTLVLHYGAETKAGGKNMIVDIEDTFTQQ
jgi:uncharacterized protein DUF5004